MKIMDLLYSEKAIQIMLSISVVSALVSLIVSFISNRQFSFRSKQKKNVLFNPDSILNTSDQDPNKPGDEINNKVRTLQYTIRANELPNHLGERQIVHTDLVVQRRRSTLAKRRARIVRRNTLRKARSVAKYGTIKAKE